MLEQTLKVQSKEVIWSTKTKELRVLCAAVKAGDKNSIEIRVKNALDAGLSRDELLNAVSVLIKEGPALDSIMEFLRALSYEENIRHDYISVVDDCRED